MYDSNKHGVRQQLAEQPPLPLISCLYTGNVANEPASDSYRTIMAYESGCTDTPRIGMFSTPDKMYLGMKLGSAEADNASMIKSSVVSGETDGGVARKI